MNILLTGGTGYIGSHTAVVLQQAGHQVVLLDNLSNSQAEVADRIGRITGTRPVLEVMDVLDTVRVRMALQLYRIDAVVHFAGLKAVGESVAQPLAYFHNNVAGTLSLLRAMSEEGVQRLVFSSSATVYGQPQRLPLDEGHPTGATNPYGRTKLHVEQMLGDLAASRPDWRIAILRYFNPVGAHDSGLIGEDPNGIPNNLMPYIARVAAGQLPHLNIWGDDYPTPDGTGIRDYIHVMDLAEGHLAALEHLQRQTQACEVFNLGTGCGTSVLEMVRAFERASGRPVPYRIAARRPGDVAACWADPTKAQQVLGWRATRTLQDMCTSAWRFVAQQAATAAPAC
ncbi:MAG: UDP-glucose 4-epimerase GalE [Tepidimonas sp.]|uniref:UDP-glucose 4-epimerase GalE n=1 Tax=Tepidimonas sp. TaxID=2002775 RepID=UPI00298F2DF5|nr:UDP-glucose 4-epimerase GalE [Tepidimonas sp.]MCS6811193.1 UDP-glucose 4-epimerase GalE [Tepidimonas sp.]MDW8337191.1 UDP-glucose 4-epimerase GalE [Tepidimonas sp.]